MTQLDPTTRYLQTMGCLGTALVLLLFCLLPILFLQAMEAALDKLHLHPAVAVLTIVGILAGSVINIPVWRIQRQEEQIVEMVAVLGPWGWMPRSRRIRRDTVITLNVGGCIVPTALAAWETLHVMRHSGWPLTALVLTVAANVTVCYLVARPVQGVGIMMPGLLSPVTSVGVAWLLLLSAQYDPVRAPIAFVGGVLGPLVGADLLHLKDITKVSAGILSIGGAGTFDGIVLSGILAALLA